MSKGSTRRTFPKTIRTAGPRLKANVHHTRPPLPQDNGQNARTVSAASIIMSGIMAISFSQMLGAPLKLVDPQAYKAYVAWTKGNFIILMTAVTEWWAPTIIRVSGDESTINQMRQMDDGSLRCHFPHRIILMANHQLYTDWMYIWWVAYTNQMHGHIHIILKESLKRIPFIGNGMRLFNFIFLSRKWETDRLTLKEHLGGLRHGDPAWLIIFPEGTNLSKPTREKSCKWSSTTGIPDMKHQLLPRTTGLRYCLTELRSSMTWLYDATIAYEGIPKGVYGQDIYTLKSSFLDGQPPKAVNIFWRRFKIADIPLNNNEAFDRWLLNRWREKDYVLEYFDRFGRFPAGDALQALTHGSGRQPRHAKAITTQCKGGGLDELLSIFEPITMTADLLSAMATAPDSDGAELPQKVQRSKSRVP